MKGKSHITTHILDTHRGRPASGVAVSLELRKSDTEWKPVGSARTDADGRASLLAEGVRPEVGIYRLNFVTGEYYKAQNTKGFYPLVSIAFDVQSADDHYHVPLLLSGHGYSTYRGS